MTALESDDPDTLLLDAITDILDRARGAGSEDDQLEALSIAWMTLSEEQFTRLQANPEALERTRAEHLRVLRTLRSFVEEASGDPEDSRLARAIEAGDEQALRRLCQDLERRFRSGGQQ